METMQQRNQDEVEIDLGEIIALIFSKLGVIILAGAIAALLALAGTKLMITPQYQSTTKMYVLNTQETGSLTQGDLQSSTLLTQDYVELIKSRAVTENTITQLGLELTHEQLLKKMNVTVANDTRVIKIQITDPDPFMATEIANSVRDAAAEHILQIMRIEAVNVVEEANIPQHPSSPNVVKNTLLGAILGIILAIVVVLVIHLSNDTIKSAEDVQKYLNMSTLGMIPLGTGDKKNKKKRKRILPWK